MWSDHPTEGSGFGVAFYGDKGTLIIDDKNWRIEDGKAVKTGDKPSRDGQARHVQNFLDCVKSRSKPNADIEIGHLSTRLCHLGNIAFRVGKKLTFDAANETFHDPEANALLAASTAAGSRCRRRSEEPGPSTSRFGLRSSLIPRARHRQAAKAVVLQGRVFRCSQARSAFPSSELDTPALLLDLDRLEHNIDLMAGHFRERGVAWRPHAKAHKCPAIAHMLRRKGAIGVTVAKVSEAEVMAAAGIDDILIAHLVVGPQKTARLAALQRSSARQGVRRPSRPGRADGPGGDRGGGRDRRARGRRPGDEADRGPGRPVGPRSRPESIPDSGVTVRGADGL